MKRILCSLLLATLPFGSALADAPKEKNAKVTLVYEHELPNVPGKSLRAVLVEYGPGGGSASVVGLHLCARAGGSDPQQSERRAGAYLSSWRELDRAAGRSPPG